MGVLDSILLARLMAKPAARSCIRLVSEAAKHPALFLSATLEVVKRQDEEQEELPYEIPQYSPGMKHCDSKDPYLRPTYSIQSDAPEIIALANSLGAYQKSEWDYANAAFEWVKRNIKFRFAFYSDAVGVLEHGKAHCLGNMNLLAALCRSAGLPTRYKLDTIGVEERTFNFFTEELDLGDVNEAVKLLWDVFTQTLPHQMLEIKIDGKWMQADPVFTPEIEAVMGYPILKLGEMAEWLGRYENRYVYLDSLPALFEYAPKLFVFITPGLSNMMEKSFRVAEEKGKQILESMGGEEGYNRKKAIGYEAKSGELRSIIDRLISGDD